MDKIACRRVLCPLLCLSMQLVLNLARADTDDGKLDWVQSFRVGHEVRAELDYAGIMIGFYKRNWGLDNPNVWGGFEFSISGMDSDDISSSVVDFTVVPKVRAHFGDHFFAGFGLGIGTNRLKEKNNSATELTLGSSTFFAPEFGFGLEYTRGPKTAFVEYFWTHRSNAGIAGENSGLDAHTVALGFRF